METIRPDDFRCNFCVEIRKETPGRTPNGRLSRFPSLVRGRSNHAAHIEARIISSPFYPPPSSQQAMPIDVMRESKPLTSSLTTQRGFT